MGRGSLGIVGSCAPSSRPPLGARSGTATPGAPRSVRKRGHRGPAGGVRRWGGEEGRRDTRGAALAAAQHGSGCSVLHRVRFRTACCIRSTQCVPFAHQPPPDPAQKHLVVLQVTKGFHADHPVIPAATPAIPSPAPAPATVPISVAVSVAVAVAVAVAIAVSVLLTTAPTAVTGHGRWREVRQVCENHSEIPQRALFCTGLDVLLQCGEGGERRGGEGQRMFGSTGQGRAKRSRAGRSGHRASPCAFCCSRRP